MSIDAKADMEQKKLLNKVVIFVCFFAQKKYSHSFITLRLFLSELPFNLTEKASYKHLKQPEWARSKWNFDWLEKVVYTLSRKNK